MSKAFIINRYRKRRFYNECKSKAEQGLARAQYNLGLMYAKGLGVSQDDKEAVKWSLASAEQGHPAVQLLLGLCYAKGMGVSQDGVMAYMFFSLAILMVMKARPQDGIPLPGK